MTTISSIITDNTFKKRIEKGSEIEESRELSEADTEEEEVGLEGGGREGTEGKEDEEDGGEEKYEFNSWALDGWNEVRE